MTNRLPRLFFFLLSLSLLTLLAACSTSAVPFETTAKPTPSAISAPVDFTSALGSFTGTFTPTRFAVQNGELVAIGTLTGTVRDALGAVVGTITQTITLPVLDSSTGTCQILNLDLGPLDLNLLGLRVQLNEINLDSTAQRGGGLLGDLLCGIANLLDSKGSLTGVANLLNQLLRILG